MSEGGEGRGLGVINHASIIHHQSWLKPLLCYVIFTSLSGNSCTNYTSASARNLYAMAAPNPPSCLPASLSIPLSLCLLSSVCNTRPCPVAAAAACARQKCCSLLMSPRGNSKLPAINYPRHNADIIWAHAQLEQCHMPYEFTILPGPCFPASLSLPHSLPHLPHHHQHSHHCVRAQKSVEQLLSA